MNLKELQNKYEPYQIAMRRHFHAHPEESRKEFETARRIREELDKMGIPWRVCGMPTGTLATLRGARPGRTILLRGDIDALSVTEETGLEYASQNQGVMHACGHDCHISMLLTAARMLKDLQEELCGTVVFCFQPAEETADGANSMIKDGALEGVDAAFGMHVWSDVPAGKVSVRTGPVMAACNGFTISIEGKSGHGAQPHLCADATVIGAAMVMNLQTVVARTISPVDTAVLTVGTFESGERWNVISGRAKLTGTTRCFSREVGEKLRSEMERIVASTAEALNGRATLDYVEMIQPTVNDPGMAALAGRAAQKVLGEDAFFDYPVTMGGEDFASYQAVVPGAIVLLGVRNEACNAVWGQHNCHYQVDESVLIKGASLHVQVALDFLGAKD